MLIEIDGISYGLDFVRPPDIAPATSRGFMLLKGYDSNLQKALLPMATYYWVDTHTKKVFEYIYIGETYAERRWTDVSHEAVWIAFLWGFKHMSSQIKGKGEASPSIKLCLEY